MEQRTGRICRHGQRASQVMIYHFVGKGYQQNAKNATERAPGDLEGDLEFLARVVRKVENIREDLGKVGPVIASQVTEAMLGRRRVLNTDQAEKDAAPVRKLLRVERDLREQLKKLYDQLIETKRDLHMDAESIQAVVEVGLALAGQPALLEATAKGIWPDKTRTRNRTPVFRLPHLTGSWALATTGLEHPHSKEVRPIVFDHTLATERDDVVLVHLNHRLVQMCLQLLRAEIWSVAGRKKLHRITARIIPNAQADTPVVIAHGRLVVLGGDNKRLHEELIFAGGELREGRFTRIQQVSRLEQLLGAATADAVSGTFQERLRALWPEHRPNLLRALEARMRDRTETLQSRLDDRASKETAGMQAVLGELQASIRAQLNEITPQLELFSIPEKDQFERDRGALERRLAELPEEMKREEQLIRARYASPSPRLFPVSVTYLVPERLAR